VNSRMSRPFSCFQSSHEQLQEQGLPPYSAGLPSWSEQKCPFDLLNGDTAFLDRLNVMAILEQLARGCIRICKRSFVRKIISDAPHQRESAMITMAMHRGSADCRCEASTPLLIARQMRS